MFKLQNWIPLLLALSMGIGGVAIAILGLQNPTAVTLRWLGLQSVPLPMGVVLAVSFALGLVGMAIALVVWPRGRKGVHSNPGGSRR